MADLAFYTAQPNGARLGVRAKGFGKRGQFHGVAHAGAGAVRFNKAHVSRRIFHLFECFFHGNFLAFGVGGGNAFALAVG